MDQILSKLHRRRDFYLIIILLLAILISTRYGAMPALGLAQNPALGQIVADFLDKLTISLIVTVFVGSFVFMITPDVMLKAKVEEVEPREIGEFLKRALQKSNFWWYNGSCGRYFRAVTLPEMARQARKGSLTREVYGLIMDPSDEALCHHYANYRRGVRSADETNPWTVKRVRQELIATIMRTAIIKHEEPLLRIRLSLVNHFSSVRFDMSSEYILLTKEDKSAPAIRLDAGTYFYQWYRDEMILTETQSKHAPDCPKSTTTSEVTAADVKECLKHVHLAEHYFTDKELEQIVKAVKESRNPYA